MPVFDSDGVPIVYEVTGEGSPIVLVHGFASRLRGNWGATGWIDTLAARGRKVVAFDCRGHGGSGKPHEAEHYANGQLVRDVINLLDHLAIERADLMGYSMGAWLLLPLIASHQDRVNRAILGGAGAPVPETTSLHEAIVTVFEGDPFPSTVSDYDRTWATAFRDFAMMMGNDLIALSRVLRSGIMGNIALRGLENCRVPTLVIAGEYDNLAGDAAALAHKIPSARHFMVQSCDHLSTIGSQQFRDAVLHFLAERTTASATAQRPVLC